MSTSHSPIVARTFKRVGEPLMNCRLVPAAGEGAFEDELIVFARFQAVFLEKGFQRRAEVGDIKDGLDRAAFLATADERCGRRVRPGRG